MRILCSNDDGIHSEGLNVLEEIAMNLSDDVWTIAPEVDQSGMSRSITLTRPLRVRKVSSQRYAVDGTPTDCVQLAICQLLSEKAPDLILSGINHGQNVADDVSMSGTVAVAFQGMSLGIPSIAFSQTRGEARKVRWDTARHHGPEIIRTLLKQGWPKEVILNINFPNRAPDKVAGVEIARQGRREKIELFAEERTDLRNRRYYWFGFNDHPSVPPKGTDLRALYDGKIAITPLHLSLTDEGTCNALKGVF